MTQEIRRLTRSDVESGLSEDAKVDLGDLIFSALPELYEHVPMDRDALKKILADQVDVEMTELSETWSYWEEGRLLGLLSVVDSKDLTPCQRNGTLDIVRRLSPEGRKTFRDVLTGHGARVEDLARPEGKYLPRMAVSAAARGRGVARKLMNHVLGLYPDQLFALHVARTNDIVIRLHTSLGFVRQSDVDLPIVVLVRPPV
ncbi:GNAT family N-acetyltransferase [Pinisolibacter aquiterrae]|uniref:GNAT family N-acetyltransferase n=1 Tax=Pinisolibacter aquiterrae TaxID=2815579 RepID=UPI001C3C8CB2|nr:GNAT family N-acetyltransferase [Pinisolibacter aquiterrae]MCC8236761.1 GNAT family N-acetyltransferase [Pinisolibacter aquiterrae]